jgi:hypothetical protein
LIKVSLQFFEDIAQRRWRRNTYGHRKSQTLGLTHPMVRVLAQYHYFDIGQWA